MIDNLLTTLRQPSITNQPPSSGEIRRNDIAVALVVLFALFLGWGLRNQAINGQPRHQFG
jgi:hypothetical protein